MAKQINFEHNGKEYTLEYTRESVKQMEREGAERDDYAFVVDDEIKVVWVNKMQPLFKSGIYNLLSIGLSFPATSFNTVEELGEAVVRGIAQMKE